MTKTFRTPSLLALASLLAAAFACRKPSAATPPQPAQAALTPNLQKTPGPSTSAAMTVKPPLDAERSAPQPPAAPCVISASDATVGDLLGQAGKDFEKGRFEEALECAREATRVDGQSVAAHHFRGAALSELGHIDEARTAYARALALDPDDPEVLRSVADLHVRRLGTRDDLELALQYVHRALPRAGRSKDRALLKDLYLLQSMALDDLGRPADALASANHALEQDAKDREARREKGVALFELCHFEQARAELARLAQEEPDAWAEHYLGLIAERAQDDVAAATHFARARQLDPDAFKGSPDVSATAFQRVVQDEVEKLPPEIRQGLARSHFAVQDLPEVADLVATDPPLSPGILGLFRPPADGSATEVRPTILLYRRNLARAVRTEDELHREVRDTLIHEVGHLNGEDDDQLRDRGL